MFYSIFTTFNTKGMIYNICVQFKDESSDFTKVRATTDI